MSRCKVVFIGGTLTAVLLVQQLISTKLAALGFVAQLGWALLPAVTYSLEQGCSREVVEQALQYVDAASVVPPLLLALHGAVTSSSEGSSCHLSSFRCCLCR